MHRLACASTSMGRIRCNNAFYTCRPLQLIVAERNLVIATRRAAAVELGRDGTDDRLDLGQLVLVVLSLGERVLLEPLGLLLDGGENSLLVVLGNLSAESLRVVDLPLDREDEVYSVSKATL
jgi:hypothetical protein